MRPNILHIFVDQQRFDTIGALGNPIIKTPHLDRLRGRAWPLPARIRLARCASRRAVP